MKNKFLVLIFLPAVVFFFVAFWIRGIWLLDPDFGWHLRMGEIIIKTGIPKTDPFSYTMPSYLFVDHEWLTNVILARLYPIIHIPALAFLFAFLAMVSLLIQIPLPIKKWSFVPFVLAAVLLLDFVGVRTQVITWFFFSILLFILFNPKAWGWRFILPFLFILWANLHGGFGIGIVTLFIVMAVRMWEKRKILFGDLAVLLLSVASTLVNPYGIRLWQELWMQISDTSLRWNILEWWPGLLTLIFTMWLFVVFSIFIVLRNWKKFSLPQLVLYFSLLIAGMASIRNMPFWLLLAFPMTSNAVLWFSKEAAIYKGGVKRMNIAYKIFSVGAAMVVALHIVLSLRNAWFLRESFFYPTQAVEFLKSNKSCGQIFSVYDWGGYLIWKFPEKKVFIDGRMPSWRWKSAPDNQSNYVFEEYANFLTGKISIKHIIDKYNIDTILLSIGKRKNVPELLRGLQEKADRLLTNSQTGYYEKFIKGLGHSGMAEIYKDNIAIIYRQKQKSRCQAYL